MVSSILQQHRTRLLIRRTVWLLLAAAHAPGFVHAWGGLIANGPDPEFLTGCIWPSLTMAFFALKVLDVAWLRFRTDLRSCVALAMVVALLHVDLIRSGSDPSVLPDCTAVLATAWAIGSLPPVRRMWRESLQRAERALRPRHSVVFSGDTIRLASLRPHCWVLVLRLFSHRGPPF